MIVGKALKQRLSMDPRVRNPATSILSLTTSSSSTTTFLVPSSHQYSGVQNIGKLGLHFHLGRPTTTKRVFKEHRSIMLTNGNFPRPTKQNHLIHRNKDSDNYNNQTAWANIIIGNDCLLTLSFVHGNDALGLLTLVTYGPTHRGRTALLDSTRAITLLPCFQRDLPLYQPIIIIVSSWSISMPTIDARVRDVEELLSIQSPATRYWESTNTSTTTAIDN